MSKPGTRREGRRNMKPRVIVTALVVSSALGLIACSKQRTEQPQRPQQTSRAVGTTGNEANATGGTTYGTPGSPGATLTIPGDQLPPPPQKFDGKIEQNAAQSTPYWPARVVPPKGA